MRVSKKAPSATTRSTLVYNYAVITPPLACFINYNPRRQVIKDACGVSSGLEVLCISHILTARSALSGSHSRLVAREPTACPALAG